MTSSFTGPLGGSKYYPRPTLFFSVLFVSFEWIHLSLVHLFEAISGDTDLYKVALMWGRSHKTKKDLQAIHHKSLISLVRPAGFEPAAYGFEALIFGTVGIHRETQGFNYFK